MNNKGVSAVIGTILMVAITVAIASTIYVYVSQYEMQTEYKIISQNISGNVTEKFRTGTNTLYYYFVIDNSFDVSINESNFYKYNVGDYYE